MYLATGFNGWGISNGAAVAMLIADQVQGGTNAWRALYNPERRASARFNQGGDTTTEVSSIDDIAPGAGAVIQQERKDCRLEDRHRRPARLFRGMHPSGCAVTWNNADSTGIVRATVRCSPAMAK
jgi:hypothetical protein